MTMYNTVIMGCVTGMLLIMGDSGSVSNQELKEVAEKGGEDWIITFHNYSPLT